MIYFRGNYFWFGSVFIKKNNQTEIFFKKNRNQFKPTGFGSVFWTKTGSNQFCSVFWFGSVFCRFGSGFFCFFGLDLVWFGSVFFVLGL